jgi:Ca-activated chloride channel family protein
MRRCALAATAAALILAGCGGGTSPTSSSSATASGGSAQGGTAPITTYSPDAKTLNIIAGSEQQAVLEQVVEPWCQAHGVTCDYQLAGSVDQERILQAGNAPYDAFWFASSVFEQLGNTSGQLRDVQPMFTTPIVFAGFKPEMRQLGLIGAHPTLAQLVGLVESHTTTVWTTNPTQSNSGATTLLQFLGHFANNQPTEPLTASELTEPAVTAGIQTFVRGFAQTPPSTGTMMAQCVAQPGNCKTLFTYEDLVIQYDQQLTAEGRAPLYAVYPKDGLAISDAPLGFYPHGNDTAKEQTFLALQRYLLSPTGQAKVEALGRRPIQSIGLNLPNANLHVFNPAWGIEANIEEPTVHYPDASVIQAVLNDYQLTYRVPVSAYYCLDNSGSMAPVSQQGDGGWQGVSQAANLLFNPAQASQLLLQINPNDRTTVDIFNNGSKVRYTVIGNDPQKLLALRNDITDEQPGGTTGIFRCLNRAAQYFAAEGNDGLKRLVILMTDGQDNQGGNTDAIAAEHVPVIAIGFSSQADMKTLQAIATATGGTATTAANPEDLTAALRTATGYK